jgi:hypothetical protein
LNQEKRPLRNFLKGMSVFLAVASIILLEIFISEYGLNAKLDWSYLSAAVLNLGVALLLKTNV